MRAIPRRHWILAAATAAMACGITTCEKGQTGPRDGFLAGPSTDAEYLLVRSGDIRYAPTDATSVAHPYRPNRNMSNWVGRLTRGERLTITEWRGEWSRVRVADGTVGWIKTQDLIPAEGVMVGTTVAATPSFRAPERVSADSSKIRPGSLLFVLETQGEFAHVNAPDSDHDFWVLTETLEIDTPETDAASLIGQLRLARELGDEAEAARVFDRLRIKYPKSALIDVAAEEVSFSQMLGRPEMAPQHNP